MSVFERRRLLAGLLKIELEIAAVTNGSLIIYSPEIDAYLSVPKSVFGIKTDLDVKMLMEGSGVNPDIVLQAWTNEAESLEMDGRIVVANTRATGGTLEIPYARGDALASSASKEFLRHLVGVVNSILEVASSVGKRRAKGRGGKITADTGSEGVMHTTRYAVGENYITMTCNTGTLQYTVTENEAGGLTYNIIASAYEVDGGTYYIGGRDGS